MLLLLTDPRIGLSLTLEAGISSGESAELIDIDRKRAIGFRDKPIISHALDVGMSAGSGKPGFNPQTAACYSANNALPRIGRGSCAVPNAARAMRILS
jgi:hypothetical protein